jgi:hypothetical protein
MRLRLLRDWPAFLSQHNSNRTRKRLPGVVLAANAAGFCRNNWVYSNVTG